MTKKDNKILSEAYNGIFEAQHPDSAGARHRMSRRTEPYGQDVDDSPSFATLDDFEQDLSDLYFSIVDSGIDEKMANDWLNHVRSSLTKLLSTSQNPNLQDLGSKF